ncbi:hypothetical protein Sango_1698600 [Sesamum angolense]|uniref:Stress up-regulated Nod 19 protein n=1 Tax=Sesamum angolense TaxID=2727404 RepID=A0AAE1WLS9_9LAMI|nr:hypothetical protein Sango_1698600 [Sesamum angolense]
MARGSECLLLYLSIMFLLFTFQISQAQQRSENGVKTDVFLSPKFVSEPGLVSDKFYYNVNFPRGHIALKSFNGEVIDEKGNPVPLHETYLHHWAVLRYYQRKGIDTPRHHDDHIAVKNSGLCDSLSQYFGLGSETRRTATYVPDPYGIEVGNPADIPDGYEERWLLNVHATDTRGAEDKLSCIECRCDLYNVTADAHGRALPVNYSGGWKCCYDDRKCMVKEGFEGVKRSLFLRYTDEYDVESCPVGTADDGCIHTKTLNVALPTGGDVVYGVAHQHAGGIGSTLYGENLIAAVSKTLASAILFLDGNCLVNQFREGE